MSKQDIVTADEKLPSEDNARLVKEEALSAEQQAQYDEVPTDDRRYIIRGFIFLLATFGCFSLWAGFVPLSSAIVTQGEVVVDSYRKSIQHYEGGIVENIYVRNGENVKAGQPLVQLETTQWKAELASKRDQLLAVKTELERLRSEQDFEHDLVFSDQLKQAAEEDQDIAEVMGQQKQLYHARVEAYKQQREALENQISQAQEQIRGLESQSHILNEQIASLQDEQKAYATLFEEGLGDGQRARELKRQTLTRQNELSKAQSNIARLNLSVSEARIKLASQKQDYLKEVGEQIKEQQTKYFGLQEEVRVAEDRVRRATIRAPEDGTIVDMQIHTVGGVISSGQKLLDLVPRSNQFVVEAKVQTQDINDIYDGQQADIRFSAFNTRLTKVIDGVVETISADRLVNEKDGSRYYLARVRVTDKGAKDMTEDMHLVPGMPAEVMIRGEDRTLFSYLLKPIEDSFARSMKGY